MAAETSEEQAARLQQMSNHQWDRLAAETPEQRQARLHVHQSQLPQPCMRTKMAKFHAHMATLDTPSCTTCSEGFPGLQLYSSSMECLQCSKYKHTPKLYSTANSIDPGSVPSQLQVKELQGISCCCYYLNIHGLTLSWARATVVNMRIHY